MANPAALLLQGVRKRHHSAEPLLEGIDLRLEAGDSVALLGDSGSGKSTLLNLIAGLEPLDAGRVFLDGQEVDARRDEQAARLRREHLGFVFQAFHLVPHLDALQNAMLPVLLQGGSQEAARREATRMLEALGLGHRLNAAPGTLSGGEQQRVALARALVHRPALVLADEPTGNLDPGHATVALELLLRCTREAGAALLMVTHSQQAAQLAQRCLHLSQGQLVEGA